MTDVYRAFIGKKLFYFTIDDLLTEIICQEPNMPLATAWRDNGHKFDALHRPVGLRDKNGQEIWEGDILRQGFCTTSRGYEDETYTGYHIGAVIILASQGVCMRKPLCHLDDTGDTFISSQYKRVAAYRCEVIGNIHDNPELLQGDTP